MLLITLVFIIYATLRLLQRAPRSKARIASSFSLE